MLKNIFGKKTQLSEQEKFIQSLDGIGDILVFETKKRTRNKRIRGGLRRLENLIKALLEIQYKEPERFNRLMLDPKFFEIHERNKEDAQFRLHFFPKEYLPVFWVALNQMLRIHEAAVNSDNNEISRSAIDHLNDLIGHLATLPNNEIFIRQILEELRKATVQAFEKKDSSMYSAAYRWYTSIVFGPHRNGDRSFDLAYLPLFDRHLHLSFQYIVSEGIDGLFKDLIGLLIDGIHLPLYSEAKIWDYGHLLLREDPEKYRLLDETQRVNDRVSYLARPTDSIDSHEKLVEWLKRFEDLKAILYEHFSDEQRKKANELEKEIREFVTAKFKYNNLLDLVFSFGAFCIYKRRYDYVRYIWEYKQPSDTKTQWFGDDISPETTGDLLSFFFRRDRYRQRFDFAEGHHDSDVYYSDYFLLLLLRNVTREWDDIERVYSQIENEVLPRMPVGRLVDIQGTAKEFKGRAETLAERKDIFEQLGFGSQDPHKLINERLIPFLSNLETKAGERVDHIERTRPPSPKKVEEFKEEVVAGLQKTGLARQVFSYFKLCQDRSNETYVGQFPPLGKTITRRVPIDKAAFFDEWNVSYLEWGVSFGNIMARDENMIIMDSIATECESLANNSIDYALSLFDDPSPIIILAPFHIQYRFQIEQDKFIAKWQPGCRSFELDAFSGWYKFKNHEIPVFEADTRASLNQVLVLDTTRLGSFVQYSPLHEGDNVDLQKGIFRIRIRAFSEDPELLESHIKEPPPWLTQVGDEAKQRDFLQRKVLLEISERFEFVKHENFVGYSLKLEEKSKTNARSK